MGNACVNAEGTDPRAPCSTQAVDTTEQEAIGEDAPKKAAEEAPEPRLGADSVVHVVEIVKSMHCDLRGFATVGTVLQWMDICACLSAERHAGLSAVTVAMDSVSLSAPLRLGSVVRLRGCVTNAFNTSMEVKVTVEAQSPVHGHIEHLTSCYFIFVAMDGAGKKLKQKLPPLVPQTEEEFDEVVLSKERRKLRFAKLDMVHKMMKEETFGAPEAPDENDAATPEAEGVSSDGQLGGEVPMSQCFVQMTQLVLPSHANHHGNTFGGQIMSWMDQAASVVAMNYLTAKHTTFESRLFVTTVGIDSVAFHGASHTGDRIVLKAGINRVFRTSMEVGVRVEAAALGGEPRHINTGFFTLVLQQGDTVVDNAKAAEVGAKQTQVPLAPVVPDNESAQRRFQNALGRRRFRLYRRSIALRGSPTSMTWTWSEAAASELCFANSWSLLSVLNDKRLEWKDVTGAGYDHVDHLRTASNERTWGMQVTSLRASYIVRAPPTTVAEVVKDLAQRSKWDTIMQHGEVREELPEVQSDVLWAVFRTPTKEGDAVVRDFSLLRTHREDEGRITIAYRSVRHPAVPATDEYDRGEVLPSGFVLKPIVHEEGDETGPEETPLPEQSDARRKREATGRWSFSTLGRTPSLTFDPSKRLLASATQRMPEAETWTELTYVLQMHAETAALAGAVLAGQSSILHQSMLGLKAVCEGNTRGEEEAATTANGQESES